MEQIIKKKIGATVHTFVVSGENFYDVVTESQKLSFPDMECCGLCGSTDLTLGSHLGKDEKGNEVYKYVDIKCNNMACRASLTFGQPKKDPDTFYLRKDENKQYDWKPFIKPDTTETKTTAAAQTTAPAQKPADKPNTGTTQKAQPKTNNKNGKPVPSGKAINYAMKISASKDRKALDELCGKVATDKDFNAVDIDYLRAECLRKREFLQQSKAA